MFTDGEVRLTGTMRLNFVDSLNKPNVMKAIEMLKDKPRGSWILIAVRESLSSNELKVLKQQHKQQESKKPRRIQTPFAAPEPRLAENSGYVVFVDSKIVLFYSNDLHETPSEYIMEPNADSIRCVNGICKLSRWVRGSNTFHRSEFEVPAIIVAYNKYMNSVDLMDQRRATNAIRRKEPRLPMTLFGLVLDLSISNAFTIMKELRHRRNEADNIEFKEFKRLVASQLVDKYEESKSKKRKRVGSTVDSLGIVDTTHVLLPYKDNKRRECYVCTGLTNAEQKQRLCCIGCAKGFHVECFAAFHYPMALASKKDTLRSLISNLGATSRTRHSKFVPTLEDVELPCASQLRATASKGI